MAYFFFFLILFIWIAAPRYTASVTVFCSLYAVSTNKTKLFKDFLYHIQGFFLWNWNGIKAFQSLQIRCVISPPDPHNLAIRCLINGDTVQSSNTDQMIFKTGALVAWVSKYVLCAHDDSVFASLHRDRVFTLHFLQYIEKFHINLPQ